MVGFHLSALAVVVIGVLAPVPAGFSSVRGPGLVDLGRHRFGRTATAEAVVARAGPSEVGFLPSRQSAPLGPASFVVAPDRSVWLLDGVDRRLLVWRAGRPGVIARVVRLPVLASDFALGPHGSLYVSGPGGQPGGCRHAVCLWRLSGSGKILWQSTLASESYPTQLRTGPDGTLYWTAPRQTRTWTPAATPAGRPLSPNAQRQQTLSEQPLPRGLRLRETLVSPHETRVSLLDRGGHVLHAWRILSRTRITPASGSTPDLLGQDPVITLEATAGWTSPPFQREYVVLRLRTNGSRAPQLSLREAAWGDIETDLRIGPDGSVYLLASSPTTGARVLRFALDPTR